MEWIKVQEVCPNGCVLAVILNTSLRMVRWVGRFGLMDMKKFTKLKNNT